MEVSAPFEGANLPSRVLEELTRSNWPQSSNDIHLLLQFKTLWQPGPGLNYDVAQPLPCRLFQQAILS